tara:strand:- start:106 stop:216 length:111 start_codon:yes stop_codon:yes gene_type:complete
VRSEKEKERERIGLEFGFPDQKERKKERKLLERTDF